MSVALLTMGFDIVADAIVSSLGLNVRLRRNLSNLKNKFEITYQPLSKNKFFVVNGLHLCEFRESLPIANTLIFQLVRTATPSGARCCPRGTVCSGYFCCIC